MNELSIPKVKDNLPSIDFSVDEYRTKIKAMSDKQLDRELERTVKAGVKGLTGFARAYHQNGLVRYERGKRTEKVKTGPKDSSLAPTKELSSNEMRIRSEEMTVDEWLDDDEVDTILGDGKGFNALVTRARIKKREATIANSSATIDSDVTDWTKDGITILKGDFRKRLADLPDGSVDLIVTDPPYPYEDIMLWTDLAKEAKRLLGKRGILFAMSGQMFLPEVMGRLEAHLRYGWTFNYRMSEGSQSRIMGRHIIQTWKPLLAYTVGKWPSGEWGKDEVISTARSKERYEWEQQEGPMQELMHRFSPDGGLIVDPFLGVGTYAVDAKAVGRRFIGVEMDEGRFNESIKRLG